jgi:hypothetical protein
MFQWVVRSVLRKILLAPETKQLILVELRELAAKSTTKIDDRGVDVASEVWDVVVSVIAGKIR